MDLFGLFENSLTPAKKLESAIRQNNVATLEQILNDGFDVDAKIQVQGGNTALHVAATEGQILCVKKLLEYKANPDLPNDFSFTPIILAIRKDHRSCVRLLLQLSTRWIDIGTFWCQMEGAESIWKNCSDDMLSVLLCATPNLMCSRSNVRQNIFHLCKSKLFHKSLKTWIKTGNRLTFDQETSLTGDDHKDFVEWLKSYKEVPQTLQHYCHLVMRRSFHAKHNVMHGAEKLPLPSSLQADVCFIGLDL